MKTMIQDKRRTRTDGTRTMLLKVSETAHAVATGLAKRYKTTLSGLFEWMVEQTRPEAAKTNHK